MSERDTSEITKINSIKELEPAIYEVSVTYGDGFTETIRLNVLDLNDIKARLGMPLER